MMVLAAVVLILGLIGLSAMVAKVGRLADEAGREQDRPLLREISPMVEGFNGALSRLADPQWANLTEGTPEHEDAVLGLLAHLRQLEASRGLLLEYSLACDDPADPATGRAILLLGDGELRAEVRSQLFARPAC